MSSLRVLPIALLAALPLSGQSAGAPDAKRPLTSFGDVRLRAESDRDSHREDGTPRDDRDRLRARVRFGARWQPVESIDFLMRVRTGRSDSQQSPHLTIHDFDGGPTDSVSAVLDLYSVGWSTDLCDLRLGRFEHPLRSANTSEILWDKDVTVLGGTAHWHVPADDSDLGLTLAAYGLPDGALHIRGIGALVQATADIRAAEGVAVDVAAGLLAQRGADTTTYVLDGNGQRDYATGILSLRGEMDLADGPSPLHVGVGVDLLQNFVDYASDDPDPVSLAFRDRRSGTVLSASFGRRRGGMAGDFEFRWCYAFVDKLAIDASFAQDDWVRFGSGGQTASTNLRGHEFGARYWLVDRLDLHLRVFAVDAITTPEDGTRFRFDLNWSF